MFLLVVEICVGVGDDDGVGDDSSDGDADADAKDG